MKNKRRNHSAQFKAKVALAAAKGDKTIAELASQFVQFERLLADAAYDGEHNHRLCREELGIAETIIPLNPRRDRKWPKNKYCRQMKKHFDKELYNQRWQIESAYSRNKRLLGSALRARTEQSRQRECLLRILTHDLMIIRRAA